DFSGRYGDYQFQNYQATFDFDVGLKDKTAQLRRVALAVRQGSDPGGNFEVAGKFDTDKKTGEFNFSAVDFNQYALRPFLAPALAPNKLVSVSLNGKGSASAGAQGESSVKAELNLANLVVADPQSTLPKSPLAAGLRLDGSLRQQLLSLRQFLITLSPTDRAKNQLQLSGRIHLAKTTPAPAHFPLQPEPLDPTPYYAPSARTPPTNSTASPSNPTP